MARRRRGGLAITHPIRAGSSRGPPRASVWEMVAGEIHRWTACLSGGSPGIDTPGEEVRDAEAPSDAPSLTLRILATAHRMPLVFPQCKAASILRQDSQYPHE
jgi:hypothetical protein